MQIIYISQYLPYKYFKWLDNCDNFNIITVEEDSEFGYILEVNFEYPTLLPDHRSDFPFCSENKKIENMKHRKLMTDLNDKNNYIIHYRKF